MIIDGKKMAEERTRELRESILVHGAPLSLAIISIAPTFATEKYLNIKRRVALEVGVELAVCALPHDTTIDDVLAEIAILSTAHNGIVLQLPYPEHIAIERVLDALPQNKDVDAIGGAAVAALGRGDSLILPPVIGAIADIATEYDVSFSGKHVVVVGYGRLVGKPAAVWAAKQGAQVTTITKDSIDQAADIRAADILILASSNKRQRRNI